MKSAAPLEIPNKAGVKPKQAYFWLWELRQTMEIER